MMRVRNVHDFWLSLLLGAFAIIALLEGRDLASGTIMNIGPGLFPRLIALLLLTVAVILMVRAFAGSEYTGQIRVAWRPVLTIVIGALLFAFLLRPVGLVGAIIVAVIVTSFGDRDFKWRRTLLVAATLAGGSSVICVVLLRQTIPLVGFWF